MPIYTRTGDRGETGLIGGERVSKGDARIALLGELDELSSWLGLCRSETIASDVAEFLLTTQRELFRLSSVIAGDRTQAESPFEPQPLEQAINRWAEETPPLTALLLPGGCPAACHLHLARTVCRRAERTAVGLEALPTGAQAWLNRLSDALFTLARLANQRAGDETYA